ncbi:MAG: hypothetical protein MJ069_01245 [Salinivirgaceae bacterium]|nr:hypothetical protein [Salinivirgaceae bacterium]
MKIKKLAFALLAVASLAFVSCDKEDDNNDDKKNEQKEPALAENQEAYLGTMTFGEKENEGVVGVVTYTDETTFDFDFKQIQFDIPDLPMQLPAMDIKVPGLKLNADKTFASDSIVLSALLTAVGIKGQFVNDSIKCSLAISSAALGGEFPVSYKAEKLTLEEYENLEKK